MKTLSLLTTVAALFTGSTFAATHTFDWNITWTTGNPTSQFERKVIGINGQWPLPTVEVNKGDRVIFNVYNDLGDHNTSIHFHGMYQNGTNAMDGPVQITQCPIAPGASFTYNFTVDQNGTYWYHSHVGGQYPDGYRAPFIVHDDDAYFANDFDEELTFTLSDWYNDVMDILDKKFLNLYNPSGAEPVPNNLIFNESQNVSVPIKPNTTYLVHVMNIGSLPSIYFWIEDHNITVVEVDGVYVEPTEASILYITTAQRYSFLLTTKSETDKNYGIVTAFDQNMFDVILPELQLNQTNWLEYNSSAAHDHVYLDQYETSDDIPAFDDIDFIPEDRIPLLPEPDVEFTLDVTMNNLDNGVNYAFFNNITYTSPKVPALYTVMSAPEDQLFNPTIYGEYTHSLVLEHMQVVQIVINNVDPGTHPFHMHGHEFQLISRSPAYDDDNPTAFDSTNHTEFSAVPSRRDTAHVRANGNMVIRFRADNPGAWMFHCHIEWHLEQGLALVLIEAPDKLREQSIPQSHLDMCSAMGVSTVGNAAGNTVNYLDLTGQNKQVADLPSGFTARGIVALVFSCVSAFLGMFVIAWYGLSDLSVSEAKVIAILEEEHEVAEHNHDPKYRSDSVFP